MMAQKLFIVDFRIKFDGSTSSASIHSENDCSTLKAFQVVKHQIMKVLWRPIWKSSLVEISFFKLGRN